MNRLLRRGVSMMCLLFLAPTLLQAHSFVTPYVLPIPFWIYVYGCAATLVVTFALSGVLAGPREPSAAGQMQDVSAASQRVRIVNPSILLLLRVSAAGCLLLTIAASLIGTDDPAENIAMTLFWVIFLLGFAYSTLFHGNLYALINPWKWAVMELEALGVDLSSHRVRYPPSLGYWPAFIMYAALIWIELFAGITPIQLSITLLAYSAATFIGVFLFGKTAWFRWADVFSVYFRLIGALAPVKYRQVHDREHWQVCLRQPLTGVLDERPEHIGLVLFVLFMLSSTAYDSIHDTALWVGFFWRNLLSFSQPIWGGDIEKAQSLLMNWYLIYRQAGLLLFPFLYLILYLLALHMARFLTRTAIPLRRLALDFCYSLIPVAVAYNFAHYYPFLVTQIRTLPQLISDPFGFGMVASGQISEARPLQMGMVWHLQVGVILFGHLVGVYLAHRVATRLFCTRRHVIVSQLPLLLLMVAYTMFGLWILSLPLGASEAM